MEGKADSSRRALDRRSTGAAFFIGTVEIRGVLTTEADLRGMSWDAAANLNTDAAG